MSPRELGSDPAHAQFSTTRWSVIVAAGRSTGDSARAALETLCRDYWYPLYAYLRRSGQSPNDAEDLTQGFFAGFLAKNYLADLSPEKGRFRSYLLGALKHHVSGVRKRARAAKRGGGKAPLPLDFERAEERYRLEPSHDVTPDRIYERSWAIALLENVVEKLERDYADRGNGDLFAALRGFLTGADDTPYVDVGAGLDMSEGAVKVAVHRMRRRYGELLRDEITRTLEPGDDVESEIRHLFAALSGDRHA